MEDLSELKKVVADNLIFYRKQNGLTQLDIAEKLNYSDKAVSKWERAEGVPDVFVLKSLAELYGIKLDDLMSKDKKRREKLVRNTKQRSKLIRIFVTILSCGLVWCLATALYVLPTIIIPEVTKTWLVFIYALCINFILLVVFSCVWGNNMLRCLSISGLIWSLFLTLCLAIGTSNIWLLLVIAAAMQVMTILSSVFVGVLRAKSKDKSLDKGKQEKQPTEKVQVEEKDESSSTEM